MTDELKRLSNESLDLREFVLNGATNEVFENGDMWKNPAAMAQVNRICHYTLWGLASLPDSTLTKPTGYLEITDIPVVNQTILTALRND